MWKTCAALFTMVGSLVVIGNPANVSCPIEITPPIVVVEYGSHATAKCSTSFSGHHGMGWEATDGATDMEDDVNFVTWTVESLKDWTTAPKCYINLPEIQCQEKLSVTVYKLPESISISQLDPFGPVVADDKYKLQCDVNNVAPVQNLTVIWYKGPDIIDIDSDFNEKLNNSAPVNVSSVLTIRPHELDNGQLISCEASLSLSTKDHLSLTSEPHRMTVYYPPVFLRPKEEFDVVSGVNVTIDCSASGNPSPMYTFGSSTVKVKVQAVHTAMLQPGTYVCNASNEVGSVSKHFTVKEAARGSPGTTAGIVLIILILLGLVSLSVVLIRKHNQTS